jgi:hypothetical protein
VVQISRIEADSGKSKNSNSKRAGQEAVEEAVKDVESPETVFLFGSSEKDQESILEGAQEATDANVVGCSTAGEIIGTESFTKSVVALAISGDDLDIKTGKGDEVSADSVGAGRRAANSMLSSFDNIQETMVVSRDEEGWSSYPKVMGVAFGPGLNGDNGEMMSGVRDVTGPMAVGGGFAADGWAFEETNLYYDGEILNDSVILAGLELDVKSGIGVAHGLEGVLKEVELTSVSGKWVEEIDGEPALDFYRDMFGKKAENTQFLFTKPIGIGIDTPEGELRIREPMEIDKERGSIRFSEKIPEDINVKIMKASADQVLTGAEKAVKMALEDAGDPSDVAAVLIHNCACRWYFLDQQDRLEEELEIVREHVGDNTPIVGWYTYGEIASPAPLNGVRHENIVIQVITNEQLGR